MLSSELLSLMSILYKPEIWAHFWFLFGTHNFSFPSKKFYKIELRSPAFLIATGSNQLECLTASFESSRVKNIIQSRKLRLDFKRRKKVEWEKKSFFESLFTFVSIQVEKKYFFRKLFFFSFRSISKNCWWWEVGASTFDPKLKMSKMKKRAKRSCYTKSVISQSNA